MPIINSVIAGGGAPAPTGTMYIISNGTYNVEDKAIANVNVPTTAPAKYLEKDSVVVGNYTYLYGSTATNVVDLTGITALAPYALAGAYSLVAPTNIFDTPIVQLLGTDTHPFNNIDLDFSNIFQMGTGCLTSAFAGRKGINSVTLKNTTGCDNVFAMTDVKKCVLKNGASFNSSYMFNYCSNLKTVVSEGSLNIGPSAGVFSGCSGLESINLDGVTQIGNVGTAVCGQYFLSGCSKLTELNMPNCKAILGSNNNVGGACQYFCSGCTLLASVKLDSLETIGDGATAAWAKSLCYYMFKDCTSLPTVRYPSLKAVGRTSMAYCFSGCTSLQSLWFYALTPTSFGLYNNQFDRMLNGCTNVTVHFPKAIQSTIGSWTQVTDGFYGTNTTVLFDLVTSLTGADTVTYTRQEKDSTATATAWNDGNDVLFYTSGVSDNANGVNEPVVGDTIYSDAACTTAVTTISAIA